MSGPAWTRTRDLFLISSISPISFRTGSSGNLAVLQHFYLRRASAVVRRVPTRTGLIAVRLQYIH